MVPASTVVPVALLARTALLWSPRTRFAEATPPACCASSKRVFADIVEQGTAKGVRAAVVACANGRCVSDADPIVGGTGEAGRRHAYLPLETGAAAGVPHAAAFQSALLTVWATGAMVAAIWSVSNR